MRHGGSQEVYLRLMAVIRFNEMKIKRFLNAPVPSNSYVLIEGDEAVVIDPGSKFPTDLEIFLKANHLSVPYIFLTHEHFDHVWGCGILREKFGSKIVCGKTCAEKLSIPQNYFNLLYYGESDSLQVRNVDLVVEDGSSICCLDTCFCFMETPGHSSSSVCIYTKEVLFSGDTIMRGYKPVIKKRHGGSLKEFCDSVNKIFTLLPHDTLVYPGHGDCFVLKDVEEYYMDFVGIQKSKMKR